MSSSVELEGFKLGPAKDVAPVVMPLKDKPGKIYTFYSFKGGVGRSMSMANIAVLLAAQGKKVLMLDFDLEAPGLEHFFLTHDKKLASRLAKGPGVIDLLGADPPDWRDAVQTVDLNGVELAFSAVQKDTSQVQPRLDIMHSGRASRSARDYTDQVQQLNWPELYTKHDVGTRFGEYRAQWIAEYDYVLIDSRTGVTDIGDLCTVVLPDHLVLLFVTNEQNISGVLQMYQRAVVEHRNQPFERSKLTVLPVLSRDEFFSENKLSRDWRKRAADDLAELFDDWLPEGLRPIDAFQKIFIPYFAIWSFGEAMPVLSEPDGFANPSSINAAYARIARLILHNQDWACLDAMADPAEIANTRRDQQKELAREREELTLKAEQDLQAKQQNLASEYEEREAKLKKKQSRRTMNFLVYGVGVLGLLLFAATLWVQIQDLQNSKLQLEQAAAQTSQSREVQVLAALEEQYAAESRAEQLQGDVENAQLEIDRAAREINRLRSMLRDLETQTAGYQKTEGQAEALAATVDALNSQLETNRAELTALSAQQASCEASMSSLRAEFNQARSTLLAITENRNSCASVGEFIQQVLPIK
ncbi:MAG: AAA family ATPase [Aliishimia sp.]